MTIRPNSGLSRPIRHFRKTDFPVPDGPSRTLISPLGIVKVMSRHTVVFPNDFVMPSIKISEPSATSTLLSDRDLETAANVRSFAGGAAHHRPEPFRAAASV
jgi:hypothetical protein